MNAGQAAADADRFAAAHRALRADPDLQFSMMPVTPPRPTPEWLLALGRAVRTLLRPIGRFFAWIARMMPDAPYAQILLWSVLALAAAAFGWMVVERMRYGVWRLPHRRRRALAVVAADQEENWAQAPARMRGWLQEADALAAEGRFAEAAHHLLFRSVEDIGRRRPRAVRPALTSRELAAASAIPPSARTLFAGIAALVERSLFGGRAVDAAEWSTARAAYAELARPGAWRA